MLFCTLLLLMGVKSTRTETCSDLPDFKPCDGLNISANVCHQGRELLNCQCETLMMFPKNSSEGKCSSQITIEVCLTTTDALINETLREIRENSDILDLGKVSKVAVHSIIAANTTLEVDAESWMKIVQPPDNASTSAFADVGYVTTATVPPSDLPIDLNNRDAMEAYTDIFIGTRIIFVTMYDKDFNRVERPIELTFGTRKRKLLNLTSYPQDARIEELRKVCAFYNENSSRWDGSVCSTKYFDSTSVKCTCNHNSAFAVVFMAYVVDIPTEVSTFGVVAEAVSIAFLFITIVILVVYRERMRHFDRVLVQINLCFALLLMHLFFVVGPMAKSSEMGCMVVMFLSHTFIIAAVVLMVMEGLLMLVKVLVPNYFCSAGRKKRRGIGLLVGWVLPLMFAGITCAIGTKISDDSNTSVWQPRLYNSEMGGSNVGPQGEIYENCWFRGEILIYAVVIPVAVALTINLCIAVRLGVLVWLMSKSAEEFKPSHLRDENGSSHARKAFRAVLFLLPILGLPWIIGFMSYIKWAETAFTAIHAAVNGLQGVMIFLHYTVLNSEMKTALKRSWRTAVDSTSFLPSVHFVSTTSTSLQNTSKRSESVSGLSDAVQQL